MSPELLGSAAAWLAHACWYLADPVRRARVAPRIPALPGLSTAAQLGAAVCAALAVAAWTYAHPGPAVGACCFIAALAAAASVNTILAPLAPRLLLVLAASSAILLVLGGLEVVVGT